MCTGYYGRRTFDEAIVKGDQTLRLIRNGEGLSVTVAYRENQRPASPGMQSNSIIITVKEFAGLLERLGLQVMPPGEE